MLVLRAHVEKLLGGMTENRTRQRVYDIDRSAL